MQKSFQKFLDGFFLLRIPLLAPVWTILILGWIVGTENIFIGGEWFSNLENASLTNLWVVLVGFSLIVASIYVVNQIVDIEGDRINHKLFILPNGFISIKTAWIMAILCNVFGIIIGLYTNWIITALFIIGLVTGVLYNLPPAQLKNHAWGGVLTNSLGHGMITFLVGWFAAKGDTVFSGGLLLEGFVSSLAPALANGAVYLATTIPDAEGDKLTGKCTFSVKYGEKATAISSAIMCFGAFVFSFFMENHIWVMVVPSAISLLFFLFFAFTTKKEAAFTAFKWPVFLLSAAVALYVPQYGILILLTFFGSRIYYRWRFGIEYPTFKAK
ncbi:MAG: UbiA family prenyltransferase [Fibrobacter sp.]|nr:UbiA family prenyltransferase [Fibrobacter sp.]